MTMENTEKFTEAQMARIPYDKKLYQDSGYDEFDMYQAGFLYGTIKQMERYDMDHTLEQALIWEIRDYRDWYGNDFVNAILAD